MESSVLLLLLLPLSLLAPRLDLAPFQDDMLEISSPGANEHGVTWGRRAAVLGGTMLVPGANEKVVHHLDTRRLKRVQQQKAPRARARGGGVERVNHSHTNLLVRPHRSTTKPEDKC